MAGAPLTFLPPNLPSKVSNVLAPDQLLSVGVEADAARWLRKTLGKPRQSHRAGARRWPAGGASRL